MIPSVFISSTISDLHYVRETARKVVKDFAMNPVMSDFGEISYMGGCVAESSCYLSVKDCRLMILIIGRRYGSLSKLNPAVSVTEYEFATAQDHKPYLITLVEKDVLNFKDVYDSNNGKEVKFPGMDEPQKTFSFIDKVNAAKQDNGIFGFSNAEDVDRILRLQFAGLFGRLLDEKNRPEKESIKDILSELQGLKSVVGSNKNSRFNVDEIVRGTRFLLEERNFQFAKLINSLGPIDESIPLVKVSKGLEDFLGVLHVSLTRTESLYRSFRTGRPRYVKYDSFAHPDSISVYSQGDSVSMLEVGWIGTTKIVVNEAAYLYLCQRFLEFKDRICGAMSESIEVRV